MKKFVVSLCLSVCTLTAVAFPSTEPFADATASGGTAYNSGDLLSAQTNALGEGWYPAAINATGAAVSLASGSLTAPTNLPSSRGNMVQLVNQVGPGARYNIPITSSNSLFYSLLIQVQDISALAAAKSDTHGGGAFNLAFNNVQTIGQANNPTGSYATLYYGATNGGYILGIGRGNNGTSRFWETNVDSPHQVGETVFVVAMYQFVAGVSNDIAALWVNPDPSTFGAGTYPTPTIIIDGVTNISTDPDVNGGSIQSFIMLNRNSTTPTLMYADELRLGRTWADVTPNTNAVATVIPTLSISKVDPSTVQLSWRGDATGFTLQSVPQLLSSGTPWATVPGSPTTSGTNFIQTDAITPGGSAFYRLLKSN